MSTSPRIDTVLIQTQSHVSEIVNSIIPQISLRGIISFLNADDRNRCRLMTIPGVQGSDYINASFVDVRACICIYIQYSYNTLLYLTYNYIEGLSQDQSIYSHSGSPT